MAPLLGPADSFNSSSATIRPDKREDEPQQFTPSVASSSRELGPADSVGRDFESLIAGRAGVLQSDNGLGDADELSKYLNDYNPNPQPTISPTISPGLDFNVFSNDSTNFFAQVEQTLNSDAPSNVEPYRPSSALSNHSVHSRHSGYSSTDVSDYITTDMDTDAEWPAQGAGPATHPSPAPLVEMGALSLSTWMNGNGHGQSTISPDAEGLGQGSRRRRRTEETEEPDDESRRLQRLEHRRSINRRSAQKHRLRRKEELESLTKTVAERDSTIALLRQELAVAKAQLKTMYDMMQSRGMFDKEVK